MNSLESQLKTTFSTFSEKQKNEVRNISELIHMFGNPSSNDSSTAAIVLETNNWDLVNCSNNGYVHEEDARKRFLQNINIENTKYSPRTIGSYLLIKNTIKNNIAFALMAGNYLGNIIQSKNLDDEIEDTAITIMPVHTQMTFSSAYFWKYKSSKMTKFGGSTMGIALAPLALIYGLLYSMLPEHKKKELYADRNILN